MVSGLSSDLDRDRVRTAQQLVAFGLAGVLTPLPFLVWAVRSIPPRSLGSIGPVPLVRTDVRVDVVPSNWGTEFSVAEWARELMYAAAHLTFAELYYLALMTALVSIVLLVSGAVAIRDPGQTLAAIRRWVGYRPVQLIAVTYAGIALAIVVPAVFRLLAELAIALVIGGTLFVSLGLCWLRIRSRSTVAVRILVAYPLSIGTGVLPFVATSLVSPTFASTARGASEEFAILVLDTILVVGGFNTWLRKHFALEGTAYFLMWVGIVVVLGWIAGGIAEFALHRRDSSAE